MDGGAWWAAVHGVAKSRTRLSNFPFTFHFHALEKEMTTHSSVLAGRIPGTEEPGGLLSMGSHRVRHDWSDSAAAAAAATLIPSFCPFITFFKFLLVGYQWLFGIESKTHFYAMWSYKALRFGILQILSFKPKISFPEMIDIYSFSKKQMEIRRLFFIRPVGASCRPNEGHRRWFSVFFNKQEDLPHLGNCVKLSFFTLGLWDACTLSSLTYVTSSRTPLAFGKLTGWFIFSACVRN